jgi:hypothetical protein
MEKGLLALERAQATGEVQREEEPESALAYLQDIYKGRRAADHVRMKAARECLPFEVPKLAVTGYVNDSATFAQALESQDRAKVRCSNSPRATQVKCVRSRSRSGSEVRALVKYGRRSSTPPAQ